MSLSLNHLPLKEYDLERKEKIMSVPGLNHEEIAAAISEFIAIFTARNLDQSIYKVLTDRASVILKEWRQANAMALNGDNPIIKVGTSKKITRKELKEMLLIEFYKENITPTFNIEITGKFEMQLSLKTNNFNEGVSDDIKRILKFRKDNYLTKSEKELSKSGEDF
jgi:hypothetical protein